MDCLKDFFRDGVLIAFMSSNDILMDYALVAFSISLNIAGRNPLTFLYQIDYLRALLALGLPYGYP